MKYFIFIHKNLQKWKGKEEKKEEKEKKEKRLLFLELSSVSLNFSKTGSSR
jgi:hypothetical protein